MKRLLGIAIILWTATAAATANAGSRYYESLMPKQPPFDECVGAMTNGIEMFSNLDKTTPQQPGVRKVFFWRNSLYSVYYLQNLEGNGLDKISCYKYEETKRRR